MGKKERAEARHRASYRKGTAVEWSRRALSAYTWMRTEKGPHREWLHRIGKIDTPYCSCDHATIQSGAHIVFTCQLHEQARKALIHRVHSKPPHLKWTRKQLRGLTFIITDRGPMKRWQWVIKRADDPFCRCGEIQNAVHLTRCRLVADGEGRSPEQVWEDREWCQAVAEFLS